MKKCPRCNRTYPDSEGFCEADGSALAPATPAFVQGEGEKRECPVCGGKAEPGEVICNFCGARLEEGGPPPPPPAPPGPTSVSPQPSAPLRSGVTQVHSTTETPPPVEEEGGGFLGTLGYIVAAIIALAAGAWFAIHLSSRKAEQVAITQPSASSVSSPAAPSAGVIATLANTLPVQVSGPGSNAPGRDAGAARQAFADNRGSLLDAYNHALAADPRVADAMAVRIRIQPDGTVDRAAIRTSTSPNPSFDAEVAKAMLGWKLAPTSGGEAEMDYPVVFAHDAAEQARLEGDLQTKLAGLSASEAPEFASAPEASPAAPPSPEVAAVPPSAAAPRPESPAAVETPAAPPVAAKPKRKPRREMASLPKPTPSLLQVVQDKLKSVPKLRRVRAYTAGGTVTLYGRVFDDDTKRYAERTVRGIPGVTSVVDTLTTDTAQWAEEQDRIARQLQNAGLDKVTVKVIGHDAYLNGQVKTALEKTRAVTIAEGAAPVTVRENLIRVEPGNMFGF
jgi:TonB family protein